MDDLKRKIVNLNATQIIVLGFLFIILSGALLLMLPISSNNGESVGFIDALFTSTSAVCVTGLVTVNTLTHWTVFGKIVIMFLIQVGGLGFMSLVTIILVILGKKITLKERFIIQESFNLSHFHGMVVFVKKIVIGTLIFEGIGALLLSFVFIREFGFINGIAKSIFHSISAFCNAGFDIVGDSSISNYSSNYIVNFVIMALIIIGGLGFTVWVDVLKVFRNRTCKLYNIRKLFSGLTLHTKLVLSITTVLILFGWIFFFISEFNNKATLGNMRFDHKLLASLFQSVTLRTAGFCTIDQGGMNYSSQLMSVILMAIGGSPGGTAGGIKTVTVGVIVLSIMSVIKGNDSINVFKKSISFYTLQKSLSVFFMIICSIFISTMCLSFSEAGSTYNYEFMDLLFETTSALGTVGLSFGITPMLSSIGKIVIAACMFIGRLGPVTIAVALASKHDTAKNLLHYPEEKILVG